MKRQIKDVSELEGAIIESFYSNSCFEIVVNTDKGFAYFNRDSVGTWSGMELQTSQPDIYTLENAGVITTDEFELMAAEQQKVRHKKIEEQEKAQLQKLLEKYEGLKL